jgi:hypothetical protein
VRAVLLVLFSYYIIIKDIQGINCINFIYY